jgi:hypothetical protein
LEIKVNKERGESMFVYIKERYRASVEKNKKRTNTIGNLAYNCLITPITVTLVSLIAKYYGWTMAFLIVILFVFFSSKLEDSIFRLLGKNAMKKIKSAYFFLIQFSILFTTLTMINHYLW